VPSLDDVRVEVEIDPTLAQRLLDAQHAFDDVKDHLDSLKKAAKLLYPEYDDFAATCNGEKIFTCITRERQTIDSTRLKHDFPDIWQQYSKLSATRYVYVARLKAES